MLKKIQDVFTMTLCPNEEQKEAIIKQMNVYDTVYNFCCTYTAKKYYSTGVFSWNKEETIAAFEKEFANPTLLCFSIDLQNDGPTIGGAFLAFERALQFSIQNPTTKNGISLPVERRYENEEYRRYSINFEWLRHTTKSLQNLAIAVPGVGFVSINNNDPQTLSLIQNPLTVIQWMEVIRDKNNNFYVALYVDRYVVIEENYERPGVIGLYADNNDLHTIYLSDGQILHAPDDLLATWYQLFSYQKTLKNNPPEGSKYTRLLQQISGFSRKLNEQFSAWYTEIACNLLAHYKTIAIENQPTSLTVPQVNSNPDPINILGWIKFISILHQLKNAKHSENQHIVSVYRSIKNLVECHHCGQKLMGTNELIDPKQRITCPNCQRNYSIGTNAARNILNTVINNHSSLLPKITL